MRNDGPPRVLFPGRESRIPSQPIPIPEGPIRQLLAVVLLLLSAFALFITAIGFTAAPSLIAVAYVMARLRLAFGRVGEDERWLLYPTLLLGGVLLLVLILGWPLILTIVLGRESWLVNLYPSVVLGPAPAAGSFGYWYQVLATAFIGLGAWWTLLGGMMIRRPAAMQVVLRPFLQRSVPELGRWLIPAGIVTVVIGAVVLLVLTW